MFTSRRLFALCVFYTAIMMATAVFYFQNHLGYEPCVLCVAQRIGAISVGVIALIAVIHGRWYRFYAGLLTVAAGLGTAVAGRHIWIQNLPEDEVPVCGPSFDYIVDAFPWQDALEMILSGDGNCADIHWSLMGLSIPAWTLVAFVGLLLVSVVILFRKNH